MTLPIAVAIALFVAGAGLIAGGVFVLVGAGWSMIAGAVSFFIVCAVLLRGVRGGS